MNIASLFRLKLARCEMLMSHGFIAAVIAYAYKNKEIPNLEGFDPRAPFVFHDELNKLAKTYLLLPTHLKKHYKKTLVDNYLTEKQG